MAGKGIIHRNTASRYKSRLSARLRKRPRVRVQARSEPATYSAQFHDQPLQQHARIACRGLDGEIRPEDGFDGRADAFGAGIFVRTNHASWPRIM